MWQSERFHCIEDRGSSGTVQCVACGFRFEADVEYPETQDCWILVSYPGSTWRSMHLKCPRCMSSEPYPGDSDVVVVYGHDPERHGSGCGCSKCLVELDAKRQSGKGRRAQEERAAFHAALAADRRARSRYQEHKHELHKKRRIIH